MGVCQNTCAKDGRPDAEVIGQLNDHCADCHAGSDSEADFDLSEILDRWDRDGELIPDDLESWVKVYDRVARGEMPPDGGLSPDQIHRVTGGLREPLLMLDRSTIAEEGRAVRRRMNRFEYENSVRDLLGAPWLQLASILPEDGERHRFNKLGEALDVSHVNFARYMQAADYALREVIAKERTGPEPTVRRFYAREQSSFNRKARFSVFNRSTERATFPLIGYQADLPVLKDPDQPFTVGDSDPEMREQEAFGVVASSYEPIEIRFSSFVAPQSGRYKLRFKGYTFWAGIENPKRRRASREKISRGRRSEPIVIYSQLPPRQLRRLGEFDFQVEPSVQELDVWLLKGESIQPDAVRLFRSRPPAWQNPLAEPDGLPGAAFNWMEVEGPLVEQWPPLGHQRLFGELPINADGGRLMVESGDPIADAKWLLQRFLESAYRQPPSDSDLDRFVAVVDRAMQTGTGFMDAMIAAYTAVLCSPRFLCLDEEPGPLGENALATRLSLFLWNSMPDERLRELAVAEQLSDNEVLQSEVERMIDDESSHRFVDAFLAYWLDLRKINDTSPDELLYPDYYLDDWLVDSALAETRLFFLDLLRSDLPARNLIDSDFTYVNERLAKHYGLPVVEGVAFRRVELPPQSVRGGLLTQASVLKVTANGTTTSPVVRGTWVNERLLGTHIPAPPPSVPAIEPDTRGATTIREQLELHRSDESCNVCHKLIDPAGFALESFDVAGGFREHYRSLEGEPLSGFGKNGQPFRFARGPAVDPSGELPDGRSFVDINELKEQLLKDERAIARNLVEKLVTYGTGAAPRFSDRKVIEGILDRTAEQGYPVQTLIKEIVVSEMFRNK